MSSLTCIMYSRLIQLRLLPVTCLRGSSLISWTHLNSYLICCFDAIALYRSPCKAYMHEYVECFPFQGCLRTLRNTFGSPDVLHSWAQELKNCIFFIYRRIGSNGLFAVSLLARHEAECLAVHLRPGDHLPFRSRGSTRPVPRVFHSLRYLRNT